jgi:hypothetical protein
MKKSTLLLLALGITITTFGQTTPIYFNPNLPHIPAKIANLSTPYYPKSSCDNLILKSSATPANSRTSHNNSAERSSNTISYSVTQIGYTYYDLQTNGSICNRLVYNADGTISATWTFSPNASDADDGWPDRGTGYNYYSSGTGWEFGVNDNITFNTRIESYRTGWSNIADPSNGSELYLCHNTKINNLELVSRADKGTGAWTEDTSILKGPTPFGNWWPRMVSTGDTLHAISITLPGASTSDTAYYGQSGSILYSRSKDGGVTWNPSHDTLPGIDSSAYNGFGGDEYAIDAKGDTIAIVAGGLTNDVVLLKSTDGGNTWTKTVVFQFPIPHYVYGDTTLVNGVLDTILTNDGSLAVLLDNSGAAHIWFGLMRILNNGDTTLKNAVDVYPYTNGLAYWNENADSLKVIAQAYDAIGNVVGSVADPFPFGRFNQGLCSFPSAGIDDSGHIFVSFSALDGNAQDGNGQFERHVYLIASKDGGHTWGRGNSELGTDEQINDIDSANAEGMFACVARRVDDTVRLTYQKDYFAGVSTNTSDPNYTSNLGEENLIMYLKQPTNQLLYVTPAGIPSIAKSNIGVALYPNPTGGDLNVSFTQYTGQVSILVTNILGSTVKQFNNVSIDGNQVSLNLEDLQSGIYFVRIETAQGSETQKIIIADKN